MKVSIIGTNGFLSNAIGKYCTKQGDELIMYGVDKPVDHYFDQFEKINLLQDALNYAEIAKSDIIIYAVGAGIQSNLNESCDLIYKLNVNVPIAICNGLKLADFQGVFITFGSVFEMGKTVEKKLFTENDILCSLSEAPNDYAVSKRLLSRFVTSYKHKFVHWHFILPTIYGENENPARLIPYTINCLKKGETLSFTNGTQTRQYIHVSEIPVIIEKAYTLHLESGMYNIAGVETLTVKEIVQLIHQRLNKELPVDCFGQAQRADAGMQYLALNGEKLYSQINYQPLVKIQEVISRY
jgi:nucleoside-diphosphate-sugar epimerase